LLVLVLAVKLDTDVPPRASCFQIGNGWIFATL
jgi:hypothetical protein